MIELAGLRQVRDQRRTCLRPDGVMEFGLNAYAGGHL